MLEIRGLSVSFGPIAAVTDVSLHVAHGELVAVLGANGAGKSTLLRAVSGLVDAQGSIVFAKQEIGRLGAHQIARLGIAHVPEGRQVFADQTVHDNLVLGAYSVRRSRQRVRNNLDRELTRFPALAGRLRQVAGTLSGGEQQMLAIARALMSDPTLMLLDEPSMGLSPAMVAHVAGIVGSLRDAGVTVLLVEQSAHVALSVCDRAYVMRHGRIVMKGDTATMVADADLIAAYLGTAALPTSATQLLTEEDHYQ